MFSLLRAVTYSYVSFEAAAPLTFTHSHTRTHTHTLTPHTHTHTLTPHTHTHTTHTPTHTTHTLTHTNSHTHTHTHHTHTHHTHTHTTHTHTHTYTHTCSIWRQERSRNMGEIPAALQKTCWNTLTKRIQYCLTQRILGLRLLHPLYPSRVAQFCAWWCIELFGLVIVGGVAAAGVDFSLLRDEKFICCRDITLQ
jgi:hypothetical protein